MRIASAVFDHASELADAVLSGATSLDDANRTATDRKRAAESTQAQLARQRASSRSRHPDEP